MLPNEVGLLSAGRQIIAALMARTGLDQEKLTELVHRVHDKAPTDQVLGPIFAARISGWASHLEHTAAFRSSVAPMTGRYHGATIALAERLCRTVDRVGPA